MLILIANAMFEATRTATLSPKPTPTQTSKPMRKGWVRTVAGGLKTISGKASRAAKIESVAKK